MKIINLTPHAVALNDGTTFPPSGTIARVSATYSAPDRRGVCKVGFGDVTGVPQAQDGVLYVVSALVSQALPDRADVVAPATGHPEAIRNDKGHIVSVPCWCK